MGACFADFEKIHKSQVEMTSVTYNSAVSACANDAQWGKAMELLNKMATSGLGLDQISCSTVIIACARGGKWEAALWVLKETPETPDVTCYGAILRACSQGERWVEAVRLLQEAVSHNRAGAVATADAVSACEAAQSVQQLPELWAYVHRFSEAPPLELNLEKNHVFGESMLSADALRAMGALDQSTAMIVGRRVFCPITYTFRNLKSSVKRQQHPHSKMMDVRLESACSLGAQFTREAVQELGGARGNQSHPVWSTAHGYLCERNVMLPTEPSAYGLVVWLSSRLQSRSGSWSLCNPAELCRASRTRLT